MKLPDKTVLVVLAALFTITTYCGCGRVDRQLTVRSEPQGALVYFADEEIGRTPFTVDYSWYGDYEVTLRKQGYESLHTHRKLSAPWWDFAPVDLFCELLPLHMKNTAEWDFTLSPAAPVNNSDLLKRAKELSDSIQ